MGDGWRYLDENPIHVHSKLARALGLTNAIIFGRVYFWNMYNKQKKSQEHYRDQRWWSYNTISDWHETDFTFWSEPTIKRGFEALRDLRLIMIETERYQANYRISKKKWYSVVNETYHMFMELWDSCGQPCAGTDGVHELFPISYQEFLQQWDSVKNTLGQFEPSMDQNDLTMAQDDLSRWINMNQLRQIKMIRLTESPIESSENPQSVNPVSGDPDSDSPPSVDGGSGDGWDKYPNDDGYIQVDENGDLSPYVPPDGYSYANGNGADESNIEIAIQQSLEIGTSPHTGAHSPRAVVAIAVKSVLSPAGSVDATLLGIAPSSSPSLADDLLADIDAAAEHMNGAGGVIGQVQIVDGTATTPKAKTKKPLTAAAQAKQTEKEQAAEARRIAREQKAVENAARDAEKQRISELNHSIKAAVMRLWELPEGTGAFAVAWHIVEIMRGLKPNKHNIDPPVADAAEVDRFADFYVDLWEDGEVIFPTRDATLARNWIRFRQSEDEIAFQAHVQALRDDPALAEREALAARQQAEHQAILDNVNSDQDDRDLMLMDYHAWVGKHITLAAQIPDDNEREQKIAFIFSGMTSPGDRRRWRKPIQEQTGVDARAAVEKWLPPSESDRKMMQWDKD